MAEIKRDNKEPDCDHKFTLHAFLGGTVKYCGKCGWMVKIKAAPSQSDAKH